MNEREGEHMFVNLSNHPSSQWSMAQLQAAKKYGEIIDIPFPPVPPEADRDLIGSMAEVCCGKVMSLKNDLDVVMVQGEFTLTYQIVSRLKAEGISCVAACSERKVREWTDENGNYQKQAVFEFVQFRAY